jgi:hypothetical protein
MKIRTDFVTNSSSCSNAEIVIENFVLLEILQRYKEMGVFGDAESRFSIGSYINFEGWELLDYDKETKTPAFFVSETYNGDGWQTVGNTPQSLSEVLSNIISVMEDKSNGVGYYHSNLYEHMKEELRQREEEIINWYTKVKWSLEYTGEEFDPADEKKENKWEFYYDQENGEKYNIGYYEDESEEEYDEESEI